MAGLPSYLYIILGSDSDADLSGTHQLIVAVKAVYASQYTASLSSLRPASRRRFHLFHHLFAGRSFCRLLAANYASFYTNKL